MATDMASEAEKQMNWFNRMMDKMIEILRRLLERLMNLTQKGLGNLFRKGKNQILEIGQRPGDKTLQAELTYDELMDLGEMLNDADVRHAVNIYVDGKIITPQDKGYREMNGLYRDAIGARTHLQKSQDTVKKLNTRAEHLKSNFKKQVGTMKIGEEQLLRLTSITYDDIRRYESGDRSNLTGAEDTSMELYNLAILTGYKSMIENESRIDNLKSDIERSRNLEFMKNYIMFTNKDMRQRYSEARYIVNERYTSISDEIGMLNSINSKLDTDSKEYKNNESRIHKLESSPIYMAMINEDYELKKMLDNREINMFTDNDMPEDTSRIYSEIKNDSTEESRIIYVGSSEFFDSLVLDEIKYETDQYVTKGFAEEEIVDDREYFEKRSKFIRKAKASPKERMTEKSEIKRENIGKIRMLDGSEIDADASEYDEITNQSIIAEAINYEEKQSHILSLTTKNYNNQVESKAQSIADREYDMNRFREMNGFRPSRSVLNSRIRSSVEVGNKYGNIDNFDQFAEKFQESQKELFVQIETSESDAKLLSSISMDMNMDEPIIGVNAGAYAPDRDTVETLDENGNKIEIEMNPPKIQQGLNNADGYTVVMTFAQFREVMNNEKMRELDSTDEKLSYRVKDIRRARLFNNIELFDEKKANSIIEDEMNPMKSDNGEINADIITTILATGDSLEKINGRDEGNIIASINKVRTKDGRNSISNLMVNSDKPQIDSKLFVDTMKSKFIEESSKISPENVENAISMAVDENAKAVSCVRTVLKKDDMDNEGRLVLSDNQDILNCVIYDRTSRKFIKDHETDDYSIVKIFRNEPFRYPDNLNSFSLIPFERIRMNDETGKEETREEIYDLNPRIGLLNRMSDYNTYETCVDNAIEVDIDMDDNSHDRERSDIDMNRNSKSDTDNIDLTSKEEF